MRSADLTNWAGSNAVAAGDFNQDGNTDVVIYNRDSKWSGIWLMQGTQQVGWGDLSKWAGWTPITAADVNKDKVADIIFYNPVDKSSRLELMGTGSDPLDLPNIPNTKPVGLGDFNRDGQFDILTNNTASGSNVAHLVSPSSTSTTSTGQWVLKYREDFSKDVSYPAWNRYSGLPSTQNLDSMV
ncbi:MAG: VCBS repeat-containing protein [Pseudanabaena sp. SU_2_4]|nr:VCBS repeat-containing protein [Pseudanabaena sp. SU_2_4]